jgi:DNA-binding transcriptional MerR regulator
VDETWTIDELVTEAQRRIAALPRPQNGQVRAVPDDRTIRYYGTIGLIDRPAAMRGRTALYNRKHVAQVVAIKRLQATGKSLAEIQALWHTLDDATLSRMSGVELPAVKSKSKLARTEFWKASRATSTTAAAELPQAESRAEQPRAEKSRAEPPALAPAFTNTELRIELAPNIFLSIAMTDDIAMSRADVAAIRAAAAPLLSELAKRRLTLHAEQGDDV